MNSGAAGHDDRLVDNDVMLAWALVTYDARELWWQIRIQNTFSMPEFPRHRVAAASSETAWLRAFTGSDVKNEFIMVYGTKAHASAPFLRIIFVGWREGV